MVLKAIKETTYDEYENTTYIAKGVLKALKKSGLSLEAKSLANLSKKVREVTLVINVESLVTTSRIDQ